MSFSGTQNANIPLGMTKEEYSNLLMVAAHKKVIEYLTKKGYNRTEQMLRQESAHVDKDGRPIVERVEDMGNEKYAKGFALLNDWIENGLDIYKFELKKMLWPVFVYSFIELILHDCPGDAEVYLKNQSAIFEQLHGDHIRIFQTIKLRAHLDDNEIVKAYRGTKYRIPLNGLVYSNAINFLESNEKAGGGIIMYILHTYTTITTTSRGPLNPYSFEAITSKAKDIGLPDPDLQEGIGGVFTGVGNKEIQINNTLLKLGALAMEADLAGDVRSDLEELDAKHPPGPSQRSLVEEFDLNIKREESADAPSRTDIAYPPSRARDVLMEVQKIREHRDRFKIESRSGGIGPGVSICMWTFHNTLDSITCIEFAGDTNLIAVGTEESYIRVWNMHGEPLKSLRPSEASNPPTSSRRLIGHSAPVYALSFSPSILGPDDNPISTAPRLLLSCSSDATIRLWSLEAWTCLVVYKGHNGPIWDISWGPFGHYFATVGWDKTARIWAQDHASALRLCVGHDSNVNQVAWHPNGAYIFSASDGLDKSVRMWSFITGECVRIFIGHTDFISALECAPNGKILASADNTGTIILWDLAKGNLIKRCKGHGKGGIYSLSFSVESTALVSGGADGTVRIWDVELPSSEPSKGDGESIPAGQVESHRINAGPSTAQPSTAAGVGGKKKGKETQITPDQISAFPTKKTPVYQVQFTRMNLIMAAGCYNP